MHSLLSIAPAVKTALDEGQPVVALESTLISHGLPYPHNLEVALSLEADVRSVGAIPATIGVVRGVPTVGLEATHLEYFARNHAEIFKLSRRDMAAAIALQRNGATTVAATMALAASAGITVFATGGIGGVHRDAHITGDISADLTELARTPVLVVCAGAKAILDLPMTLEYLETLGVPIVGLKTDEFPAFYSRTSGLVLSTRIDSPEEAAVIWQTQRAIPHICSPGGLLLCVPPPLENALSHDTIEAAITHAMTQATAAGIRGPALTPFLLAAVAEVTHGASITANVALLRQNAQIAAQIAVAIAGTQSAYKD